MNPQLPADLFTSCLTTPIKTALKWFTLQSTNKLVPNVSYDMIESIPGILNDRRTMLGELNWIFTAITDTIAWNTLPKDLFQKLFRQDLLVASLFRNFLLADRILRSYDCTPISVPALPQTYRHPMWDAWDLALDLALSQLPDILESKKSFEYSPFFEEQLTAFQVWLDGSEYLLQFITLLKLISYCIFRSPTEKSARTATNCFTSASIAGSSFESIGIAWKIFRHWPVGSEFSA